MIKGKQERESTLIGTGAGFPLATGNQTNPLKLISGARWKCLLENAFLLILQLRTLFFVCKKKNKISRCTKSRHAQSPGSPWLGSGEVLVEGAEPAQQHSHIAVIWQDLASKTKALFWTRSSTKAQTQFYHAASVRKLLFSTLSKSLPGSDFVVKTRRSLVFYT